MEALRGSFARPSWGRTGNLVLDLLIVVVLMAVTVSGVMVSGAVLPTFGWYAQGYYFWDPLHAAVSYTHLDVYKRQVLAEAEKDISEMLMDASEVYAGDADAMKLRTMHLAYESVEKSGGTLVVPSAFSEGFVEGGAEKAAREGHQA